MPPKIVNISFDPDAGAPLSAAVAAVLPLLPLPAGASRDESVRLAARYVSCVLTAQAEIATYDSEAVTARAYARFRQARLEGAATRGGSHLAELSWVGLGWALLAVPRKVDWIRAAEAAMEHGGSTYAIVRATLSSGEELDSAPLPLCSALLQAGALAAELRDWKVEGAQVTLVAAP